MFMKSSTMMILTISEHIIMAILHFCVKNLVLEQKQFHLSTQQVFYRIQEVSERVREIGC